MNKIIKNYFYLMQKFQNIQDQDRRKRSNIRLGDSQWVIIIK